MRRNRPCSTQNAFICRFWRKHCYFVPDWDISTFKRSFYSVLHGERSAHCFMRRNRPCSKQNAIICRFRRKLCYFVPDSDISPFKRSSIKFCTQNVVHTALCVGTSPAARKSQSLGDFDESCYFVPDRDISTFQRSFYSVYTENVVHTALRVGTGPAARKTQSFVVFDENSVISFRIEIFRRLSAHLLSFTRRTYCTLLCASEQALHLPKRNHLSILTKTLLYRWWSRYFDV
jgi:hypothetical protein